MLVDRENLFFVDRLMMMGFIDGKDFLDEQLLFVVIIIVLSATFNVSDVSDETRVIVYVIVDDLSASVGQKNVVKSLGVMPFAALELAHVDASVIVFHGQFELVHGNNGLILIRIT